MKILKQSLFVFLILGILNFSLPVNAATTPVPLTCAQSNLSSSQQADFQGSSSTPYAQALVWVKDFGFYTNHICWASVAPVNNPAMLYTARAEVAANSEMNTYSDFLCKVFEISKAKKVPVGIRFTNNACVNSKTGQAVPGYLSINLAGISNPALNPYGSLADFQKNLRAENNFQNETVGILFYEASRFAWAGVESNEMGQASQEAYMVFGLSLNSSKYTNDILYYDAVNTPQTFGQSLPTPEDAMSRFDKILHSMVENPVALTLQGIFTTLTNAQQNTRTNTVVITNVQDI